MTLQDFEEYADENIENEHSDIGKTTLKVDGDIVDEYKKRVKVSTNKDIGPVVEAVLLEELGRSEDAEEKMEEFQQYVA